MKNKEYVDVFGNPVYPGAVILISSNSELQTRLLYGIKKNSNGIRMILFYLSKEYKAGYTDTYILDGFSNFRAKIVNDKMANVVCISNPYFNLNLNNMFDIFKTVELGVEEGFLPKNYKIGNKISFKMNKMKKKYAILDDE